MGVVGKVLLAATLLLILGAVNGKTVPYFEIQYFPAKPVSNQEVEVTVYNVNGLAGSVKFVWIRDGSVVREKTESFGGSNSVTDTFSVSAGEWKVIAYVYDRLNPPQLINTSSITFSVNDTVPIAPASTPTPSQSPATPSGSDGKGSSSPSPARTPAMEQNQTPEPEPAATSETVPSPARKTTTSVPAPTSEETPTKQPVVTPSEREVQTPEKEEYGSQIPGFEVVGAILGILAVVVLLRKSE